MDFKKMIFSLAMIGDPQSNKSLYSSSFPTGYAKNTVCKQLPIYATDFPCKNKNHFSGVTVRIAR